MSTLLHLRRTKCQEEEGHVDVVAKEPVSTGCWGPRMHAKSTPERSNNASVTVTTDSDVKPGTGFAAIPELELEEAGFGICGTVTDIGSAGSALPSNSDLQNEMNQKESDHSCVSVDEPLSLATSTPLPKQRLNKRPNIGVDNNRRPRKRAKSKKRTVTRVAKGKLKIHKQADALISEKTETSSAKLNWGSHRMRSVGNYCIRKVQSRKKFRWGCQRLFKVDYCLNSCRKLRPNFPKKSKRKRRMKTRQKLNIGFSPLICRTMQRRRFWGYKRRCNMASLTAIPICNLMPNIGQQTCQEIHDSQQLEPFEDIQTATWQHEKTEIEGGLIAASPGVFRPFPLHEAVRGDIQGMEDDSVVVSRENFQDALECGEKKNPFCTSEEHRMEDDSVVVSRENFQDALECGEKMNPFCTSEEHRMEVIHRVEPENFCCIGMVPLMEYVNGTDTQVEHKELQLIVKSEGLQTICNEEAVAVDKMKKTPRKKKAQTLIPLRKIRKVTDANVNSLIHRFNLLKINDNKGPSRRRSSKKLAPSGKDLDLELGLSMQLISKDIVNVENVSAKRQPPPEIDDPVKLLMVKLLANNVDEENADEEKEKWWKAERKVFQGRIDSFTSRMHLILGDRKFKSWKGSVVDSVVGVYLTQNVSDNLSCAAYMSLAAKYPLNESEEILELTASQESVGSNSVRIASKYEVEGNEYFVTEPEQNISHELENNEETIIDGQQVRSSLDAEEDGRLHMPCEPSRQADSSLVEPFYEARGTKNEERKGEKLPQDSRDSLSCLVSDKPEKDNPRGKKRLGKEKEVEKYDWDSLRRKHSRPRGRDQTDSVDWDSVRRAKLSEVAETIKSRGQQVIIGGRIQNFLNNLVNTHGCLDLEWLRYAPPDLAKKFLLEKHGLAGKSVGCLELLTLQHKSFPVDTNIARIAVRLGWVPVSVNRPFHRLLAYPSPTSIQQYLWPRLNALDQGTLYELHYHMITFGKVFCTKVLPNCNACPMKGECKHFASAVAWQNRSLPAPSRGKRVRPSQQSITLSGNDNAVDNPVSVYLLDPHSCSEHGSGTKNSEPIVEEPKSPPLEMDIEDFPVQEDIDFDAEEIPTIRLNNEEFCANVKKFFATYNKDVHDINLSKDMVPLSVERASIPLPKLKLHERLRTEHQVYEIPDCHELLQDFPKREHDDLLPYLLAIWTPGEIGSSSEQPKTRCNSQEGDLCDDLRCFRCQGIREEAAGVVRGTILIPIRTALKGRFPLNGTYFQVNEVFADFETSYNPILVKRSSIWSLKRSSVLCGNSIHYICKGLSTRQIQLNFSQGYVCIHALDRATGAPRPLSLRFHCKEEAKQTSRRSKMEKEKKQTSRRRKEKEPGS